jgi:hypothetical protein
LISNNRSIEPEQLFRMISASTANIESAMIQIVGTRAADDPCLTCLQGRGIWNCCTYVQWEGVKICANCHWRGQDAQCYWPTWEELNPNPPALRVNDYDSDDDFNHEDGNDDNNGNDNNGNDNNGNDNNGNDNNGNDNNGNDNNGNDNNGNDNNGNDNNGNDGNDNDGNDDDFQVCIQALNNRLSAIQPSIQRRIQVDRYQSLIDQCIRDLCRDVGGLVHAVDAMQRAQDQEMIRVNAELAELRAQLERELRNLSRRST